MYTVQTYLYNEVEDEFQPVGEKEFFKSLDIAKLACKKAYEETDEYQLIKKVSDESFCLWHDEF